MDQLDLEIFDLSPIAMWLQDFSGVKQIFEQWVANGIKDIEGYLMEDHSRLQQCLESIHTLRVNQSTLKLYEAENLDDILASFQKFLDPQISTFQIKFFASLWNNTEHYIPVVNYTTQGKRLDIQLRGVKLRGYEDSWKCLLMTTENISDYQHARRFAESLFTYSPTALWLMDFSAIKLRFDQLRLQRITDLQAFMQQQPDFVERCFNDIRFIDINQAALKLFKQNSVEEFYTHLPRIFQINQQENFRKQLLQLWQQQTYQQRESCYYTADGQLIYVMEQLNIFPQNTHDWGLIQVALTDITEQKQLEAHLHFLGRHDLLTELHNRSFFTEEVHRLEQLKLQHLACIYLDLNGLKGVNDRLGHDYGDLLLKQFSALLKQLELKPDDSISRIGGDEFVILLSHADSIVAQEIIQQLQHLIEAYNQQHPMQINVAMGYSCLQHHATIADMLKGADQLMYFNKQQFYRATVQ